MEPYLKLRIEEGELLKDARRFRQLVDNLIYLTITRPQTAYCVGVISQFIEIQEIIIYMLPKKIYLENRRFRFMLFLPNITENYFSC